MPRTRPTEQTRDQILAAALQCLLTSGYGGLSTRTIAERAGVPLSQIHYHFGSKQRLVLALLEDQDRRLLDRQTEMYAQRDAALSKRWEQACDFLDEDVASGYVRVLQEMTAAGLSDPEVARAVRTLLTRWFTLLTEVAGEAEARHGSLGPFTAGEVAALCGAAFLGAEQLVLLGLTDTVPVREALRRVGDVLRELENG